MMRWATMSNTEYIRMSEPQIQLLQHEHRVDTLLRLPRTITMDTDTKLNVEQSWKDNKCVSLSKYCKWFLVAVIAGAFLIYQSSQYNNPSKNSITRQTVERVAEYDTPYFIFAATSELEMLHVESIKNDHQSYVHGNGINVQNIADFRYDPNVTSWTVLASFIPKSSFMPSLTHDVLFLSPPNSTDSRLLLIPPFGSKIKFAELLTFSLWSYARCDTMNNETFDTDVKQNLISKMFAEAQYGIKWGVDSTEYLKRYYNLSKMLRSVNKEYLEYTFVSTTQHIQLSLVEVNNEWNDSVDYYYETKLAASQLAEHQTLPSNVELYCYRYVNKFIFYINAKSTKTAITISRLKEWWNILSETGGIFSPTLTALSVLFAYALASKKCGCAKKQGLSDGEKLKIALYLQELGLLTNQQYETAVEYKRIN
eukprot:844123_1